MVKSAAGAVGTAGRGKGKSKGAVSAMGSSDPSPDSLGETRGSVSTSSPSFGMGGGFTGPGLSQTGGAVVATTKDTKSVTPTSSLHDAAEQTMSNDDGLTGFLASNTLGPTNRSKSVTVSGRTFAPTRSKSVAGILAGLVTNPVTGALVSSADDTGVLGTVDTTITKSLDSGAVSGVDVGFTGPSGLSDTGVSPGQGPSGIDAGGGGAYKPTPASSAPAASTSTSAPASSTPGEPTSRSQAERDKLRRRPQNTFGQTTLSAATLLGVQ